MCGGVISFKQPASIGRRLCCTSSSVRAILAAAASTWPDCATDPLQQSGFLSKAEYVTPANIFVDASAADYVTCFQQSLDCSEDKTDESQRKLLTLKGGKLQLEMSIKLRLLQSARDVSYVFTLEPVAVERIDILESKLKNQREELEKLRANRDNATRIFLYAESKTWLSSSKLLWDPLNSDYFALTADKTSITVLHPGVYAVGVLVNHLPAQTNNGGTLAAEKWSSSSVRCDRGSLL
ncbi:hypothetical protein PF005_g14964 [Phytophthora fragariae]|uniref:Uncharacterized protein n=3 Tax=Phytophthora fragariae TaxID=53985 RepID=A0A6A3XF40_9STRA|nr:hypothetical protein PF005_g14964 [Phytophthora fragariae]